MKARPSKQQRATAGNTPVRWRRFRMSTARSLSIRLLLIALLVLPVVAFGVFETTRAKVKQPVAAAKTAATQSNAQAGKKYLPTTQPMMVFAPINVGEAARQEALAPSETGPAEIKPINPPGAPPRDPRGTPISISQSLLTPQNPLPSVTGVSPAPTRTFSGEFLSGSSIPPDTMGAVGTTHVVTVSNNQIRFQDRNGAQITRMTLTAFWSSLTLEGGAAASAFDPKVYFDRFNNRFIFFSSANSQTLSSAILVAVSATADPTGTWFRYGIDADPAATAAGGIWADYPSIGFNKNWIVAMYNEFGYGTSGTGYIRPIIYAIDKANAYTGPVSLSAAVFTDNFATGCVSPFEGQLACGFTMAPAITEDNTTDTEYLIEDWDAQAAQLRVSKITGPVGAPVLTVGTQFPQSLNSWRFNALRLAASGAGVAGASGGYVPQRQQSANLVSGTRLMSNDSRIQNSVFRNGSLWATHTVMLPTTPTAAGVAVGGAGNPIDNHSGIQWWQVDTSIETGLSTLPTQRGRIEDPLADNCHDGNGLNRATAPCNNSTANQVGQFFAFPNISVNQNNDVLVGFTQFSAFTYPSAAYAFRASGDAVNTMRDLVVYRPGQANYNIGGGAGTARQNRWGDTSASQTDPLNDTDFWTVQEFSGSQKDFGIGIACPWETWWALVKPSTAAPATTGTLLINEFRLRGPQGVNDEFVELYNPSANALKITTTDNSDGWALVYSPNGTTAVGVAVIPNGTVVPAKGHLLIARNQDAAAGPTVTYSLNSYPGKTNPSTTVRGADSDVGYAIDNADNGGFAIFNTSTPANWTAPNRVDSVGFAGIAVGLFKEGTGIPNISATTPAGQMTFARKLPVGSPQDTGDNATDFRFLDPVAEVLTVTPSLGAAGPENLDGPVFGTGDILNSRVDNAVCVGCDPNAVRDPTPDIPNNSTFGTVDLRVRLRNYTGSDLTRLRFRIIDISTTPEAGVADLRARSSSDIVVAISPGGGGGTSTVRGTTLETPPTQAIGGGYNATLSANSVTAATPFLNGSVIDVRFLLGVQTTGNFRFAVAIEGLPKGGQSVSGGIFGMFKNTENLTAAPTAAPARISGVVTTEDGSPLAGVTVRLSGGQSLTRITDSAGSYRFDGVSTDNFYAVTPEFANYHFAPANRSFSLLANKTDATFTATADAAPEANAIDSNVFFVRQHYLDFLGREPDPDGLNYWVSKLNQCNGDADCLRSARIDTSAAFFQSIEFRVTGGYIYRLYEAGLGRQLNYGEFATDRQQVVGGMNLDAAKAAFASAFASRAEFAQKYQAQTSGATFVDALLQSLRDSGGVDLTSERANLLNRYNAGGTMNEGRALVLREVGENASFASASYNRTFVVMEYFGYLRRGAEQQGNDFWLQVLNSNGGDYRGMVCSFLTSREYQQRFGPVVTRSNSDCSR